MTSSQKSSSARAGESFGRGIKRVWATFNLFEAWLATMLNKLGLPIRACRIASLIISWSLKGSLLLMMSYVAAWFVFLGALILAIPFLVNGAKKDPLPSERDPIEWTYGPDGPGGYRDGINIASLDTSKE
ncbi:MULTISPECIES: DUF3742 family protein [Pseudomonas]|uniref:DUF3742 family protein n=1 Tax=Pseudomonas TaxID=286 RepID=UPI0015EBF07E|nr:MULTISPECIES: DUF3742 family protein [Pseudomonas]